MVPPEDYWGFPNITGREPPMALSQQVFDHLFQHDPLDFEGLSISCLCAEPFDLGQLGPERIGFGDLIPKPLDLGRLSLEFISFSGPSPELPDLSNFCLGANDFRL
ncbi:hypothetical protein GUJ93_ZPchr0009g184 [Zizania palustris]|uniref:Uncharacterized protein n=1 Tax=Zizania palustris TaxID=103762 RepID=A0A8J5RYC7_ZIZPA|nr:hypothetical protein GUJ93_ZPchr0009g184 [Zizania palustris]